MARPRPVLLASTHVPDVQWRTRSVVDDLIVFQETGKLPETSPTTEQKLTKARTALVKKRQS